jgi:hypothetical protein
MGEQISWGRSSYESRAYEAADDIETFVSEVLGSIDEKAARRMPAQWAEVCRFFAGCARAARAQGQTPEGGGRRIVAHLSDGFPGGGEGSAAGFYELMHWLSKPDEFRPTALRLALEKM